MRNGLPFSVQERDVDLLILEQLHVSPAFLEWFSGRAANPGARFESARHSVYQGNGESDVLLLLRATDGGRVAVMIEDKIGAPMQPRQCERYHERGQHLCERGEADRYITVLCAPAAYLAGVPAEDEWQTRIAFEEIADWFGGDTSAAAGWRRAILVSASSKVARARQADNRSNRSFDPALLALKEDYRRLVETRFADLVATPQKGRDREYYLKARALPSGIRLKHSFFRGEVSLIFEQKWAEAAERLLAGTLPPGAWLVRHGSELHVRKATEVLDPSLTLAEQEEAAIDALDTICRLAALAPPVASTAPV